MALGSGASRGWSHIGILKGLLREGIEPDVVCGTSVGAIIGAAYLAGNMAKLEEWVLGSSRADVLRFFSIGFSRSGFVDIERMNWFLHSFVAEEQKRIESLSATFAAVATNLENGREVWLSKGGLAESVRASMAMPGLFPAVCIDDQWRLPCVRCRYRHCGKSEFRHCRQEGQPCPARAGSRKRQLVEQPAAPGEVSFEFVVPGQ